MKAAPVSPAAEAGTELHLFGNSAGEDGVKFGVKAFLIVEEAPGAKHLNGHSLRLYVPAKRQRRRKLT